MKAPLRQENGFPALMRAPFGGINFFFKVQSNFFTPNKAPLRIVIIFNGALIKAFTVPSFLVLQLQIEFSTM